MRRSALPSRPCARSAKCRAQQATQRPTAPAATGFAMSDCASPADAAPLLRAAPLSWLLMLAIVFSVLLLTLFLGLFLALLLAKPALRCFVMILQSDHQAFHRPQRAQRDKHDQRQP